MKTMFLALLLVGCVRPDPIPTDDPDVPVAPVKKGVESAADARRLYEDFKPRFLQGTLEGIESSARNGKTTQYFFFGDTESRDGVVKELKARGFKVGILPDDNVGDYGIEVSW